MSEEIRFFLPGPTHVPEAVRQEMTHPPVGHRAPSFKALYAEIAERLPTVFRTAREVVTVTGSGTLGLEIALASLVRRSVLCLTAGAFSERWLKIARSLDKDADQLSVPWGKTLDPDLIREALRRRTYDAVTVCHNETSTGVLHPLEDIARAVREESHALLLVDAVSSLAGAPLETDAWGLDVVVTSSQKALAVPPGLALLAVSERAEQRAAAVERRGFYTDVLRYLDQHRRGGTITTPAMAQYHALHRALGDVLEEGLEARWARHRALRARVETWVTETAGARGVRYASSPDGASPTVSCLRPPSGWTAPGWVAALAERGFTVGGGYGDWKESTFRIGHMGAVRMQDLERLLAVCDQLLARETNP